MSFLEGGVLGNMDALLWLFVRYEVQIELVSTGTPDNTRRRGLNDPDKGFSLQGKGCEGRRRGRSGVEASIGTFELCESQRAACRDNRNVQC